jgi:hypothetical protein
MDGIVYNYILLSYGWLSKVEIVFIGTVGDQSLRQAVV